MVDNRRKYLTILKGLYSGDRVQIEMSGKSMQFFEPEEQEAFSTFQFDVGNLFVELKEELDKYLEAIADYCPEEPDPRKWGPADWAEFDLAVAGYKYEDILRTYAAGIPNIHLIWAVIEDRLGI